MILVTVGIRGQFNRLIKEIDRLKKQGKIKEKVVAQISDSDYKPENIEDYFKYESLEKMINLIKTANVVVTHGGVGSISLSLQYGKPTIVVPRLKRFNEHTDDHQLQITKELEKQGRVIAVYEIKNLGLSLERVENTKKIKKSKKFNKKGKSKIEAMIVDYLKDLESKKLK